MTEIEGVDPVADPAVHGRLAPLGHGKDTTSGHWELMGITRRARRSIRTASRRR